MQLGICCANCILVPGYDFEWLGMAGNIPVMIPVEDRGCSVECL